MASEFSPDSLIQRAQSSTGFDGFGSEHFLHFLRAWCEDLESARLSEVGRSRLASLAVRVLETRLRVEATLRQHPEILDVPLPRIVRIAGFPRSGTTLLHQLLSLGTRRRALLRWELVAPIPPPEATTYRTDPRIDQVGKPLSALRGTLLERMHWVEATDPEECPWGFTDLSGILGRGCVAVMPCWGTALFDRGCSHRETYVDYRHLVQILLWRNPLGEDDTLVLKSPTDTDCLSVFLDVFPEAQVVLLHRDPFRTLTSACQLAQFICEPYLSDDAVLSDDHYLATMLSLHMTHADAMIDVSRTRPDKVLNIRYTDLMSQPTAVVGEIEQNLGLAVDAHDLVETFLERQRTGTRAAPPAAYKDFGATPTSVHASLARYMDTFGVSAEAQRITEPKAGRA